MHRILYAFATLALSLLSQPARFHPTTPGPRFDCRMMADDLAETGAAASSDGRPEDPPNGQPVRAVVFPGVEKWGNGQLGADAEWESLEIVVRSKVLI